MVDAANNISTSTAAMEAALAAGGGVVRLAPTWVPRSFCTPGRRIRLHPDDYFPFGEERGGIDERWLSSTVRADNGPLTGEHEGVSMVVGDGDVLLPFDRFVDHLGAAVVGDRLWDAYGGWPAYSKFFDNQNALPLHVHQRDEHAALVGKPGKPEAYYFPPQMNDHLGEQGISFFGLHPETTPEEFKERLSRYGKGGDNRITDLSRGFRIRLGTGWDIPGGVLHAPASICTYEPQAACDVFCMCESWSNHREVPEELLWKDVPEDRRGDLDFIVELLDWDANIDPHFLTKRFMEPVETSASVAAAGEHQERWIVYRSPSFSAKELTVAPGGSVVVEEEDAYGCIVVQGRGRFGGHTAAASTLIRYGALTDDEFYVSAPAASAGVRVTNESASEPLVILKHYGPGNTELAQSGLLDG